MRDAGLLLALFAAGVLTRAPLVGEHLASWDAVQYALGLVDFDVTRHQPHPPGSILYVALGRLLLGATGSAQHALAAISVVASGVAVVLCYVAGRAVFGRPVALAGTVLYLCSPVAWYYGAVALPYALEGALALAAVALLWWAAEGRRVGPALGAAVVLAVAGGVRQTTMLLLLPLWLFATWEACGLPPPGVLWRERRDLWRWWGRGRWLLAGLLLLGALCLAWVVPLLVLSGGVGEYVTASRRLSSLIGALTSVPVLGIPAVVSNLGYLLDVAAMGLGVALVPFAVFLVPGVRWPWRPLPRQAWFLTLWAAPALAVYLLVHVGQAGYLLLLWPLACYGAGTAALVAGAELRRLASDRWPLIGPPALLALLVLVNGLLFLGSPLLGGVPAGLTRRTIEEHDATWRGVHRLVQALPAGEVAVLTGTQARESFRLATYYLPDAPVYAVGLDRDGDLGVAFAGHRGEHSYAGFMAGVPGARRVDLPPGTRRLLILDHSVSRLFPPEALREVPLTGARSAWLWPADAPDRDLGPLVLRSPLGDG